MYDNDGISTASPAAFPRSVKGNIAELPMLNRMLLDGGGFRGLSSLYLLKEIMTRLSAKVDKSVPRPLLPCDYFDLIVGTSTGGLIAAMLGIFHMDVDTCIAEYIKMGPKIFPEEGPLAKFKPFQHGKIMLKKPRFKAEPLEKAIQEMEAQRFADRISAGMEISMRFEVSGENGPRCKV